MKIIITESQFKKIKKLIKEDDSQNEMLEKFVKVFQNLVSKNKEVTKTSTSNEIKIMQIVLKIVTSEKIELNGVLDEKTESVIKKYQTENNLKPSGYFDLETIKKLSSKFFSIGNTTSSSTEKTDTNISKPPLTDDEFYKTILNGIGAPVTDENMKFFYGWRQSEGGKAAFNPFNTTMKKENSTLYNCLGKKNGICTSGVRNYSNQQDGIDATLGTLKSSRYSCITDGLKNNIGAKEISNKCIKNLETWGTGGLLSKVLGGSKLSTPPISTSTVKTVAV